VRFGGRLSPPDREEMSHGKTGTKKGICGPSDAVVNMDEDKARETAQRVLDEGMNAHDGVMGGLAAGMEIVGKLYDGHEYFVPELLLCADASTPVWIY
jgi:methanogenic corrinoid protein MtbC1